MNDILSIHKGVLSILENERRANPRLYYKPRQQNNSDRLSQGYWFIGNDGYLMIGFAEGGDSKEKVHNIGFVVDKDEICWLEFSAQGNQGKAKFLESLASKMSMSRHPKGKAKWYKYYKMPYSDALTYFILNDLPIILNAINASSPMGITLISENDFVKYQTKLNSYITVLDKVARICWNDNGWQLPSGAIGKSMTKGSYEHDYGFGHEEWIFNPLRVIDGYCYSYLEPINTKHNIHEGRIYNIHLYSINPKNEKCYVGVIKKAECIAPDISTQIHAQYKSKGWIKEMITEANAVNANSNKIKKTEPHCFFNVRFKYSDIDILPEMLLISNNDSNTKGHHYVLMDKKEEFAFEKEVEEPTMGTHNPKNTNLRQKTVNSSSVIDPIHDKMQNNIVDLLKSSGTYDPKSVFTEHNRVDIKAKTIGGEWHFFEVKTDSAKLSIRKALGQILEYTHYPTATKATKMYVVSCQHLTDDDKKYLKFIRDTYKIGLWYRHYSFDAGTLSAEY